MAKVAQEQKQATGQGGKGSRPRVMEVREKIPELFDASERGYVELSQLLAETYHKEYFKEWGFENWADYVEKEAKIEYRKSKYFIEIGDAIKSLELPKSQIEKIGWTKWKDIALVITKKNAKSLLEKAAKMTAKEVADSVRVMRKTGGKTMEKGPVTVKLNVTMGESEHRIVIQAIDEAKKICNSDNMALALEMICQDWLSDKGVKPEITPLEDHIEYLEKVYGVKMEFKVLKKKESKEQQKEAREILDEAEGKGKGKGKEKEKPKSKAKGKGKGKKDPETVDPDEPGEEGEATKDINDILNP